MSTFLSVILKVIFTNSIIWIEERVLDEWFKGVTVRLKKGDLTVYDNWSGVTVKFGL